MATLFTKIINGEIPARVVYKDDVCFAIEDINPQAPTHLLVIPRREIARVDQMTETDRETLGHVMMCAGKIARERGLVEGGYRLVINAGDDAGQTVPHIHVHLLSGRALTWPPG